MSARDLAINVLYKIEVGEAYSNTTLNKELEKSGLNSLDKGLASELVYGVMTWKLTLDEIIARYSSIKLKKISPWIINILRIGIYQIAFLDKIPVSAAVNESVNLAKRYGHEASARFVNAVLRKIEKNEIDKLIDYIGTKPKMDDEIISILTSHPLWMVNELLKEYDKKFVTELLNANNITPDITIRVNTLRTTREELKKLLELKNIDCKLGKLPDSILAKKMNNFEGQLYVVQDEAAQLACLKLDPQEGDYILDACAAPGGKTTYLAQLMKNNGKIDAWDIHENRVRLIKEASDKLGISIINERMRDASLYYTELADKYDRILLDVPCTGIGVIRKKPDIKWTRQPEDIEEIVNIQYRILDNCSRYLKAGGTLVYSTCTILDRENGGQVRKFLEEHNDFELLEETKLYPHIDNTDGFYIAKLIRK
ncbi:MAG: 16S rRNA (cytosine(967)-C(5))-methyltransferase RsmB [Clostridia bacterium]|nr:16S rRNA (cytosine(967)-C(5))-methyltransferase RsmB [Clostridia bacterium]